MGHREQLQLRLPKELKDWIAQEAARNCSSQNSEVIRALRTAKDIAQRAGRKGEDKR